MPKMKTKKSAAKRFTVQGSGGIKRIQGVPAPHPHQEVDTKRKRHLRGTTRSTRRNMRFGSRDAAVRLITGRSEPCQESNVA